MSPVTVQVEVNGPAADAGFVIVTDTIAIQVLPLRTVDLAFLDVSKRNTNNGVAIDTDRIETVARKCLSPTILLNFANVIVAIGKIRESITSVVLGDC